MKQDGESREKVGRGRNEISERDAVTELSVATWLQCGGVNRQKQHLSHVEDFLGALPTYREKPTSSVTSFCRAGSKRVWNQRQTW